VWSGDKKLDKAGAAIAEDTVLEVQDARASWVSRGGIKLALMRSSFAIDVTRMIALDVGALDRRLYRCALEQRRARIYAVDAVMGSCLETAARPRVVVLERVNARHLTARKCRKQPDIVVCDASSSGRDCAAQRWRWRNRRRN